MYWNDIITNVDLSQSNICLYVMQNDKVLLSCDQFEEKKSLNTFKQLWNDREFTDVTLSTVDDLQIKAHKVILSAC